MALYRSHEYQVSFELTGLSVQEKKFNTEFQDDSNGGHPGFPIRTTFAIFDLPRYSQRFESIDLSI